MRLRKDLVWLKVHGDILFRLCPYCGCELTVIHEMTGGPQGTARSNRLCILCGGNFINVYMNNAGRIAHVEKP